MPTMLEETRQNPSIASVDHLSTWGELRPAVFTPRQPMAKIASAALVETPDYTGRLVVKFRDDLRARPTADRRRVASKLGASVQDVNLLLGAFGLEAQPVFTMSEEKLTQMEARAAALSNKGQPDLAGMMYITAPNGSVPAEVARQLNALDAFEWVSLEQTPVVDGGDPECGDGGACDDSQSGMPFCMDVNCCENVCAIDPFCCDFENTIYWPGRGQGNWDAVCYWIQLQICGTGAPPAICAGAITDCFEVSTLPGCTTSGCCESVCTVDPFCCEVAWDSDCVLIAFEQCINPGAGGATPNFTDAQGYLTPGSYMAENMGAVPANVVTAIPLDPNNANVPLPGWQGQGYRMDDLELLGEFLISIGIGEENLVRGKGRRIGVVEFTALVDHEELTHVTQEPATTQIIWPFSPPYIEAGHGTATLGIIGAKDNGAPGRADERGIIGMQPEADMYFFPTVTVEEGGRLLNAIANAIAMFEPGDILSFSIGYPPLPLCSNPAVWALFRVASDSLITCCCSAGNSSFNIDNGAQFGGEDSGCIIVGSVFPGRNDAFSDPGIEHCRLGYSNFCGECEAPNQVHVSAWGESVATLGYGSLYLGDDDPNRSYTNTFNGTSAACPQVASLASAMQGIAIMMYDTPLLPEQIRQVLGSGFPQCGVGFAAPPGSTNEQIGDFATDEDPNWVQIPGAGALTDTIAAGRAVIETPWFDGNPNIDGIQILTGTKLIGSAFSIKALDALFLIIRSEYINPNHPQPGQGPGFSGAGGSFPGRLNTPTYVIGGQITDFLVEAHAADTDVLGLAIQSAAYVAPTQTPTTAVEFVELYNFITGRWSIQGATVLAQSRDTMAVNTYEVFGPLAFVRSGDEAIAARFWTVTLSYDQAATATVFYDLVNIVVEQDIGIGTP
ncbi:MAG: S8 family serine peptidase [Phycisphaerales bacterium]|nr:S8 family serine peptidase [Phycisphaerales bacterium]